MAPLFVRAIPSSADGSLTNYVNSLLLKENYRLGATRSPSFLLIITAKG